MRAASREAAKEMIATQCDAYVMHGDPPSASRRRSPTCGSAAEAAGLGPMHFGVAAYTIVRDTEGEAARELARITNVSPGSPGYANYRDWIANTQLEQQVTLEDYSVSNRGLRAGLVGTPEQVAARIRELQEAGVDLLLLQCSPQLEEMERFAAQVMPLVPGTTTTRVRAA